MLAGIYTAQTSVVLKPTDSTQPHTVKTTGLQLDSPDDSFNKPGASDAGGMKIMPQGPPLKMLLIHLYTRYFMVHFNQPRCNVDWLDSYSHVNHRGLITGTVLVVCLRGYCTVYE